MATEHDLVAEDVQEGLAGAFEIVAGVVFGAPFEEVPLASGAFRALSWSVEAQHTGPFVGIDPTGQTITIEGITIVNLENADLPIFQRYVDWSLVLTQLNIGTTGRTLERVDG